MDERKTEKAQADGRLRVSHRTKLLEIGHHVSDVDLKARQAPFPGLGVASLGEELARFERERCEPVIYDVTRLS